MFKRRLRKQIERNPWEMYDETDEEVISGWTEDNIEDFSQEIKTLLISDTTGTHMFDIEPEWDDIEHNLILHINIKTSSPLSTYQVDQFTEIIKSIDKETELGGYIVKTKGPIITPVKKRGKKHDWAFNVDYWIELEV